MSYNIDNLEELVEALKKRERIIVAPNYYEVVKGTDAFTDVHGVAIGELKPLLAVLDKDGVLIASIPLPPSLKDKKLGETVFNLELLEVLGKALNCTIEVDTGIKATVRKDDNLMAYEYAMVRFDSLFEDGTIYPLEIDKDDPEVMKTQLFYQIFDAYGCGEWFHGRFAQIPNLPLDLPGIYVPFLMKRVGETKVLQPLVYKSHHNGLLRPLPLLCGASYSGEYTGKDGMFRCGGDRHCDEFLLHFKYLKHTPGKYICSDWEDLEIAIDYSQFNHPGSSSTIEG